MIIFIAFAAGLFAGGFLGSVLAFGIQSHLRVRRKLKEAEKALEARETAPDSQPAAQIGRCPRCAAPLGMPINSWGDYGACGTCGYGKREEKAETKPVPDFTGGIGPTAIANREAFLAAKDADDKRPRFAHPGVLNPDLNDIREASREAVNERAN